MIKGSLCLILCIGMQYATGGDTGYVYAREADAWLRLHTEPVSWAEAGMRCYLEGGVLASPTTRAMAHVMKTMMAQNRQRPNRVFTGINSILSRRDYKSLEGVPLAEMHMCWAPGEPDTPNLDEECLALTSAGALAHVNCGSTLPYFCRKQRANSCGPKDNGYKWEPRTGSCYKFHRAAKTWISALVSCQAEGGHLAIINSEIERYVLKEIYDNISINEIIGADDPDYISIGLTKLDNGLWVTINGQTLSEAGFSQWAQFEPNNSFGMEKCGTIYRDGLLNDAACFFKFPYICEITP